MHSFSALRLRASTRFASSKLATPAVRPLLTTAWLRNGNVTPPAAPSTSSASSPTPGSTNNSPSLASRAKGPTADSGLESAAQLQAAMISAARFETSKTTVLTSIDGETSSPPAHPKDATDASGYPAQPETSYLMPHPHWQDEYLKQIFYTHRPPQDRLDKLALATIRAIRFNFDWMSGYVFGKLTPRKALTRIMFLETVPSFCFFCDSHFGVRWLVCQDPSVAFCVT